jgi:hypothetical protein
MPFAAGLIAPKVVKAWSEGDYDFTVTEEGGQPFPFYLSTTLDGREIQRQGFDAVKDAEAHVYHLIEPLPIEARPGRFEPSTEDRIWWAIESDRQESELDRWLETACPEPALSVSGEWRDFGDQHLSHEEGGEL